MRRLEPNKFRFQDRHVLQSTHDFAGLENVPRGNIGPNHVDLSDLRKNNKQYSVNAQNHGRGWFDCTYVRTNTRTHHANAGKTKMGSEIGKSDN